MQTEHEASAVVPNLMDYLFKTKKGANKISERITDSALQWRMSIAYRRFVALAFIMRPQSFAQELPAWKVAEALGVTAGSFSRVCRALSKDMGGLKHPSMRSDAHSQACSLAKQGNKPVTDGRRAIVRSIATVIDERYRASEERGIKNAIDRFKEGKPWSKMHTRMLHRAGLIDDDGLLTSAGVDRMNGVVKTADKD